MLKMGKIRYVTLVMALLLLLVISVQPSGAWSVAGATEPAVSELDAYDLSASFGYELTPMDPSDPSKPLLVGFGKTVVLGTNVKANVKSAAAFVYEIALTTVLPLGEDSLTYDHYIDNLFLSPPAIELVPYPVGIESSSTPRPEISVKYYGFSLGGDITLDLGEIVGKFGDDSTSSMEDVPFVVDVSFKACQATAASVSDFFGSNDAVKKILKDNAGSLLASVEDSLSPAVSYAWYTVNSSAQSIKGFVSNAPGALKKSIGPKRTMGEFKIDESETIDIPESDPNSKISTGTKPDIKLPDNESGGNAGTGSESAGAPDESGENSGRSEPSTSENTGAPPDEG